MRLRNKAAVSSSKNNTGIKTIKIAITRSFFYRVQISIEPAY